jgi:NAD(P)-dependent dehydrogenase (short-subunit alcohol dehydrogenase family)
MEEKKTILVTGANSGLGKATSILLAKTGAKVVMMSRDQNRGRLALEEVKHHSQNPDVDLMICDLGSKERIEQCCQEFRRTYKSLDVLINNAGVILPGYHTTQDGFELQFGVNHLGHFLLTNRLLDLITKSAPARIINISSGAHKLGKIHFEDVNLKKNYTLWRAYSQSKLANILFTYLLAEKLKNKNVTVNTLHPGAVASNMGINRETGFGKAITQALKPFFQSPAQAAEPVKYLALSKDLEGVTGAYFHKHNRVPSSKQSYDLDLAQKLWNLSEELLGLSPTLG